MLRAVLELRRLTPPRSARKAPGAKAPAVKGPAAAGLPEESSAELEDLWSDDPFGWGTILAWALVHALGEVAGDSDAPQRSRSWIDELLLGKIVAGTLQGLGLEEGRAWRAVALLKILTVHQGWFRIELGEPAALYGILGRLLADTEVQQYLQVHRHEATLWFNKESLDELLRGLLAVAAVEALASAPDPATGESRMTERSVLIRRLRQAETRSGYRLEQLLAAAAPKE